MGKKPALIDPSTLDVTHVLATQEDIRQYNRQRFEMEMLTGVLYTDDDAGICVGYQDVREDAFWCRGHMPGFPLMPGVLICEAAAQLASFYVAHRYHPPEGIIIGFGGLDEVKFRGVVRPGDRLFLTVRLLKYRPNVMMVLDFEATVNGEVVTEGKIKGVAVRMPENAEN